MPANRSPVDNNVARQPGQPVAPDAREQRGAIANVRMIDKYMECATEALLPMLAGCVMSVESGAYAPGGARQLTNEAVLSLAKRRTPTLVRPPSSARR